MKRLIPGLLLLASLPVVASNIPLRDWPVASQSGRIVANAGTNPAGPFQKMTPCRVVDTGGPAGTYGGPNMGAATTRNFDIDSGPCSGIPANAVAYSLNITVDAPNAANYVTVWNTGASQPLVSTLNFAAGQTIANAAIVPAGTGGSITVYSGASLRLIIDINGYFATTLPNTQQLFVEGNYAAEGVIRGTNNSTSSSSSGVVGEISSTSAGGNSAGVRGVNRGTGALGIGVWGSQDGTGWGVYGSAAGGVGVYGQATATTGAEAFGVYGHSSSSTNGAGGVVGVVQSTPAGNDLRRNSGVRALSKDDIGLTAITENVGFAAVRALIHDATGTIVSEAYLACNSCGSPNNPYAVWANGTLGASGTKNFVEPHPTDPSLVIKYTALEGNEAGTYFRGRARTSGKMAFIPVPEDFKIVTASDGLGVQITPIRELAQFAVVEASLDGIVVKSNRDVEFFYTVNGVRKAYREFEPIQQAGSEFIPEHEADRLPTGLAPELKARLIANGTYNEDGSVNMSTAERMGWAAKWREDKVRNAQQGQAPKQ